MNSNRDMILNDDFEKKYTQLINTVYNYQEKDKVSPELRKKIEICYHSKAANLSCSFSFSLDKIATVKADILNVKGQLIRNLSCRTIPAGNHSFSWSGDDENGYNVASGVYFFQLRIGDSVHKEKFLISR